MILSSGLFAGSTNYLVVYLQLAMILNESVLHVKNKDGAEELNRTGLEELLQVYIS